MQMVYMTNEVIMHMVHMTKTMINQGPRHMLMKLITHSCSRLPLFFPPFFSPFSFSSHTAPRHIVTCSRRIHSIPSFHAHRSATTLQPKIAWWWWWSLSSSVDDDFFSSRLSFLCSTSSPRHTFLGSVMIFLPAALSRTMRSQRTLSYSSG